MRSFVSLLQSVIVVEIVDESESIWVLQLLIAGRLVLLVAVDCVYFTKHPVQPFQSH